MADCIDTGFPQFPCDLVQMQYCIGDTFFRSHSQGGTSGRKEGKEREEGRKRGKKSKGMYKGIAIQVETRINTNKKTFHL